MSGTGAGEAEVSETVSAVFAIFAAFFFFATSSVLALRFNVFVAAPLRAARPFLTSRLRSLFDTAARNQRLSHMHLVRMHLLLMRLL